MELEVLLKKFVRKVSIYLPLVGILTATVLGILLFPYDKNFQLVCVIAAASSYVAWGFVYHYIRKDLYLSVILEYIIMALFGVLTLFFIIFRA